MSIIHYLEKIKIEKYYLGERNNGKKISIKWKKEIIVAINVDKNKIIKLSIVIITSWKVD